MEKIFKIKNLAMLFFLSSFLMAEDLMPDFDIGGFYNIQFSMPTNWSYFLDDISDIPSRKYTSPDSSISFLVVSGAGKERIKIEEIKNDYLDQLENDSCWKINEYQVNGIDVVCFQSFNVILIGACFQQSFFQGTLALIDTTNRQDFLDVYNSILQSISPFIVGKKGDFIRLHPSVSFDIISYLVKDKYKNIILENSNNITEKHLKKLIKYGAKKIIIKDMPKINQNDIEKLNSKKLVIIRE